MREIATTSSRTIATLIVFAAAYAIIGWTTRWIGMRWIAAELWLSPSYQPPLPNQVQLVALASASHVMGVLWKRRSIDKALRALSPTQVVLFGVVVAVISYLPLVALSLLYGYQQLSLRDWAVVPTLAQCWSVGGPALTTVGAVHAVLRVKRER